MLVRILDLPQENWSPKLLFEIVGGIDSPIVLDEATKSRSFGHFACVLVDLDLTGKLLSEFLVERESFAFFVRIECKKLPLFCDFCRPVGHDLFLCKRKAIAEQPGPAPKPSTL